VAEPEGRTKFVQFQPFKLSKSFEEEDFASPAPRQRSQSTQNSNGHSTTMVRKLKLFRRELCGFVVQHIPQ
jgi:hypothetical protein